MAEEKKLKFEQALAKLEQIVSEIEEGKVSLEESIAKYAEGIALVKHCRGVLDDLCDLPFHGGVEADDV